MEPSSDDIFQQIKSKFNSIASNTYPLLKKVEGWILHPKIKKNKKKKLSTSSINYQTMFLKIITISHNLV